MSITLKSMSDKKSSHVKSKSQDSKGNKKSRSKSSKKSSGKKSEKSKSSKKEHSKSSKDSSVKSGSKSKSKSSKKSKSSSTKSVTKLTKVSEPNSPISDDKTIEILPTPTPQIPVKETTPIKSVEDSEVDEELSSVSLDTVEEEESVSEETEVDTEESVDDVTEESEDGVTEESEDDVTEESEDDVTEESESEGGTDESESESSRTGVIEVISDDFSSATEETEEATPPPEPEDIVTDPVTAEPEPTPETVYCVRNGLQFDVGFFVDPEDSCSTCECDIFGEVRCRRKSCKSPECGVQYQDLSSDGCCTVCNSTCSLQKQTCPKTKCKRKHTFYAEDSCCPQCGCKLNPGSDQFISEGVFTSPKGCMCKCDKGKIRCGKSCPVGGLQCVDVHFNETSCEYECPQGKTCSDGDEVIRYDEVKTIGNKICVCAGKLLPDQGWSPNAFCTSSKITKSIKQKQADMCVSKSVITTFA